LPGKSKLFLKLPENRNFSKICLEKSNFFRKFAWKNRNFLQIVPEKSKFFVKLPEKIEISLKFAWKNRNFVDPGPQTPGQWRAEGVRAVRRPRASTLGASKRPVFLQKCR